MCVVYTEQFKFTCNRINERVAQTSMISDGNLNDGLYFGYHIERKHTLTTNTFINEHFNGVFCQRIWI